MHSSDMMSCYSALLSLLRAEWLINSTRTEQTVCFCILYTVGIAHCQSSVTVNSKQCDKGTVSSCLEQPDIKFALVGTRWHKWLGGGHGVLK